MQEKSTSNRLYRLFIRSTISLILLLCFHSALAVNIDKIVVFGDSLSDNGNLYKRSKLIKEYDQTFPIIPRSPPYYLGHFSDGPAWPDHLARQFNFDVNNNSQYSNYAFGGARAENGLDLYSLIIPALETQVAAYTTYFLLDFHAKDHLYILWIGANDYLNGRDNVDEVTSHVVNNIKTQIDVLIRYGARYFLIINMPDFANTPYSHDLQPSLIENISQLSKQHNLKLTAMLEKMQAAHPNLKFINMEVHQYFDDAMRAPDKYGIKNTKDACIYYPFPNGPPDLKFMEDALTDTDDTKKTQKAINANPQLRIANVNGENAFQSQLKPPCANPKEYLFWDQVHPSSTGHYYLANFIFNLLKKNGIEK